MKEDHDNLIQELKVIDRTDPDALDAFLKKHALTLPETHQITREIQYGQIVLFKYLNPDDMDTNALLKKSYFCKQLLDLADSIDPGFSKWRGQLLFEMQSAAVVLAQRALHEGKISNYQAQEIFMENLGYLKEAIAILQVEPDCREDLQAQMQKLSSLLEDLNEEVNI